MQKGFPGLAERTISDTKLIRYWIGRERTDNWKILLEFFSLLFVENVLTYKIWGFVLAPIVQKAGPVFVRSRHSRKVSHTVDL